MDELFWEEKFQLAKAREIVSIIAVTGWEAMAIQGDVQKSGKETLQLVVLAVK